jgi:CHAT domain-containing protein/tetratricopeptide (TPR) repeat protein
VIGSALVPFRAAFAGALFLIAGCDRTLQDTAARSPFFIADSLRDERRFAQAHPEYRRLRDSFALAQDTAGWWRAQLWWSQTLMRQARTDSAEVAIRDAFLIAGSDSLRQAWTYLMRCGLWSRLGRSDEALADCAVALGMAERLEAGDLQARIHMQLGTVYSRRGLFRRSVEETERALKLERQYGQIPHQLAGVLNSMGVEYASSGRLTEAAAAYEEGLAITRRVSDTSTGGYLISNLAALRAYTGRYDQAIELMRQSLASARVTGDTSSIVYAHNSLAEYFLKLNNLAAAREQVEQSLAISGGTPAIYQVIGLINLGLIAIAENNPDSAQAAFARALPSAVSGGFAFERFRILSAQVRLAVDQGDRRSARRLVNIAKTVADSLGSSDAELDALTLEGRVAELEGRPEASRSFLEGIDLLESWRGRLAMGDLRLGITEPKWAVYEGAIRTLLARGDTTGAFGVSERARARMLLEVMAERSSTRDAPAEVAIKQRLRQRFEESSAGGDSSQQRIVAEELRALQDSLEQLERSRNHPAPAPLAEIRDRLLKDQETALVSVFWGEREVFAWSVTGNQVRGHRVGPTDSLEAMVDFLRRAIERPGDNLWRAAAAGLFQRILLPLELGQSTTILATLDGPLARLPLEVLVPSPTASPLGATHRIIYGPSASVLARLTESPRSGPWQRTMLAVGNPRGSAPAEPYRPADRGGAIDLPFAQEEASSLHALYRDEGADLLVGREGTVERWLALQPERYRYLHFATHARANDRQPDQTRLILADGALDLASIRRLELTAELVTLSACETALGRRVRGEGVIGLSHAFLSAGARSTIVTLWPVTDRSTLRFMTDLYRELHAGGRPADALRTVRQRWIVQGGATSHPAFWAPFILLGDPNLQSM